MRSQQDWSAEVGRDRDSVHPDWVELALQHARIANSTVYLLKSNYAGDLSISESPFRNGCRLVGTATPDGTFTWAEERS